MYQNHLLGPARIGPFTNRRIYGQQYITAVSTSLALMQIQVNALLLLLDQQHPAASIRDHFQRLISEGVEAVGIETMQGIKSRIQEGIIQQEMDPVANGEGKVKS